MSTHIPGSGKKAPFIRRLEVSDVRIIGVEFSGDGEAWADYQHTFGAGGQSQGGFPQLLDLLQNGERILCRTQYADIYKNGSTGVPKTGPIYELKLFEVQPAPDHFYRTREGAAAGAGAATGLRQKGGVDQ